MAIGVVDIRLIAAEWSSTRPSCPADAIPLHPEVVTASAVSHAARCDSASQQTNAVCAETGSLVTSPLVPLEIRSLASWLDIFRRGLKESFVKRQNGACSWS